MHLFPLPVRVPIEAFKPATITLTLFDKNDKEVF